MTILAIVLGVCLFLYGAYYLYVGYMATRGTPQELNPGDTVSRSTEEPVETRPADNYEVPADQPRRVILPAAGAEGYIQKVGVDQYGAVAVPSNVHVAGWFVNSPKPGSPGVSIIDGHVRGKYAEGVFSKLHTLKKGDVVRVEFGDRSIRSFTVVDSVSVPVDKATDELYKNVVSGSQLTLITCGGRFDKASQEYQQRILVRARLDG